MAGPTLADLPEDVLVLVFPYLRLKDFISLCQVDRHFHKTFLDAPSYWRYHANNILNLPQHFRARFEGSSWRQMCEIFYKRARLFIWGSPRSRKYGQFPFKVYEGDLEWPTEIRSARIIGSIIDMQCAIWAHISRIIILTSGGNLFCAGTRDIGARNTITSSDTFENMQQLFEFPDSWNQDPKGGLESRVFIRQFSASQSASRLEPHILGLSASGDIWCWNNINMPAQELRLAFDDIRETRSETGLAKSVAASSCHGAAFITGRGIVFWDRVDNEFDGCSSILVSTYTIPGTSFQRRSAVHCKDPISSNGASIGEVKSYTTLSSGLLVFYTHLNKVFAVSLKSHSNLVPKPIEIKAFASPETIITGLSSTNNTFADESFTVFTSSAQVLTISITQGWEAEILETLDIKDFQPHQIPALQDSGVVSVSNGSDHILALHADGRISAYGQDPGRGGSLGLGTAGTGCMFRGLRDLYRNNRPTGSSGMINHATLIPHYIWFEYEKMEWLQWLNAPDHFSNAITRLATLRTSDILLGEFSEWVEQEGKAWDDFPDTRAHDAHGLGSYFVLKVSSSRYHGAALVLVNDDLAERVRQKHIVQDHAVETGKRYRWVNTPFPRIELPSSGVMDGSDGAEISLWKYGMPPKREP